MNVEAQKLNWEEREKLFALLLIKLQEDLGVSIKVKLELSQDNKIIPHMIISADKNEKI